eukprot:scaffold15641_cov39-Attheya_sp.AAC.1
MGQNNSNTILQRGWAEGKTTFRKMDRNRNKEVEIPILPQSSSTVHIQQIKKRSRRRILSEEASQPTPLPTDSVPVTDIEETFKGFQFSIPSPAVTTISTQELPTHKTFMQYVASLDDWEQQLLSSTQESTEESKYDLHELLTTSKTLYLVTDGGAVEGHGYFGW